MTLSFRHALNSGHRFLFDGSVPTVLFEKGIFINRSFDEANLATPDLVRTVHEQFRGAGADVLTTNTWAANRVKLSSYGFGEKLEEINRAGAELARKALEHTGSSHGQGQGYVAGCIGPLGLRIEPWGPTSFEEARAYFAEQAKALQAGGVDLFVLESFADLNEIQQAILAIHEVSELPIAAMMTPNDEGATLYGTEPEWYIQKLRDWGADLVGVNGGNGPAPILDLLKRFRAATDAPIILNPSAGLPRQVDGRLLYMASPEYLGEFARQALSLGAVAVGGCSGTTPAHTRAMRGAIRQAKAFEHGRAEIVQKDAAAPLATLPFAERSRFSAKLAKGEFVTTVELVPPKGTSADKLLEKARKAKALGADAINVPDGPRAMARMSALATALLIEQRVGMETLLHYACRDRNLLGM